MQDISGEAVSASAPTTTGHAQFHDAEHTAERETGSAFMPRFDAAGLVTAVVQEASTREILMLAFMDAEAIARTRATGLAHFHSRSRGRLWLKGETSGNVLKVRAIRVDCDQDALLLLVDPAGPACHTGAPSCFYRELGEGGLSPVQAMGV